MKKQKVDYDFIALEGSFGETGKEFNSLEEAKAHLKNNPSDTIIYRKRLKSGDVGAIQVLRL